MPKIVPSILSADFSVLPDLLTLMREKGCDTLHLDVMDGHFVPNITFGPIIVDAVRKLWKGMLDVHLMIEEPWLHVEKFAEAGSDLLTFHVETGEVARTLQKIRAAKTEAGLSLNPPTPIQALEPFLSDVDLVLVMSVNPGFGGQEFIPDVLPKIRKLRELNTDGRYIVEVDGGIKSENVRSVTDAGADWVVCGSAIFSNPDPRKAITEMRRRIESDV